MQIVCISGPALKGSDVLLIGFFDLAEQVGGKDKTVQFFIGGMHDVVFGSFPFLVSFTQIHDIVSNPHHGVHVVGIDNGCHIEFHCNIMNQLVDDDRGFRVQT